ncbi:DUF3052 family protein [Kocuria rhizophila]|uniref:DUF3052 domain-containing protein n=1 Tax=Kocuria rhizophila (strain ATCC 9341 / DSM 348 / NBRC 103217 / DC2201) TaxID=378753 RepID=B2GG01_KOCRD|nr:MULTISPECIES: DUF3052 domain-containing protein [Kocuria]HAG63480.1 DUF3052 domain-containing protein [Kocuria sp.]ASE10661.1 DUF3052 domain-containing protein [Kocuria rhizophila]MBK4119677.1 DUF3052 domain-containing protein [Kocuria rhizophila]MCC5673926.1 DUF3052 domain-containing protein [Kocuria rhizophila]MDV5998995.1 DUF3052 domain-containing protein [Kocuria rhizophila]
MSEAKAPEESIAEQLELKDGDYVQEFGYDDDVDADLRERIEAAIGSELFDEDAQEVVDAVVLWWRDGDGDLVDELVDVQTTLDDGGVVWLLTPKAGRDDHVSPADIQEAASTAGLHVTSAARVSSDWSVSRLVPKRNF